MTRINRTPYQDTITNGLQSIIINAPDKWRRYDLLIKLKNGNVDTQIRLTKDDIDELITSLESFKKQLI